MQTVYSIVYKKTIHKNDSIQFVVCIQSNELWKNRKREVRKIEIENKNQKISAAALDLLLNRSRNPRNLQIKKHPYLLIFPDLLHISFFSFVLVVLIANNFSIF